MIECFWSFYKNPRRGEIYNIGGGKFSNCSILEALNYLEKKSNLKIKKEFKKENRVGDHVWYVSNMKKFKVHYPNWKQKYSTSKIIDELIFNN